MPRITIRKNFLLACIAGLAATAVSIGHAQKAGILDDAARAAEQQAGSRMCPAARSHVTARTGGYRTRYLNHTPVTRFARRNG